VAVLHGFRKPSGAEAREIKTLYGTAKAGALIPAEAKASTLKAFGFF